ncbi:MAG: L,D-transpeptidase family protein [Alphaproteobacteria bacterium]|jgi:L,D-peptidoglycan transpeptidase YkuD (ErfK/YbiS/YcfS/YnhG family)|nr:L,D-transpeptidase family protein [Alphaproteobacteria bacterium]
MNLIVTSVNGHRGVLKAGAAEYRCALGPAGIWLQKQEGDGVTPAGQFPMRALWYRADRLPRPRTGLPVHEIRRESGWCDAPEDPNYNRPVQLPYPASAEHLWRADHVYDLVVTLGHNDDPVVSHAGSAIFLHIASPDFSPTEGCVAIDRDALVEILGALDTQSHIDISAG